MIVNKKDYELKMYIGPMWSFKTTRLINLIKDLRTKGKNVFVFAPEGTQRDDRPFLPGAFELKWEYNVNDEKNQDASILGTKTRDSVNTKDFLSKIEMLKGRMKQGDWIAIDEIQFFNIDVIPEIKKLSRKYNIAVAGLDKNYTSRIFETTQGVAQFATQIVKLVALCFVCQEQADFYDKKSNKKEGIGGGDIYSPKCYKHVNIKTKSLLW